MRTSFTRAVNIVDVVAQRSATTVDWLVEQGLTSHSTQFGSFRRRFYRSDDPTNSVKALKEGG